MVKNQVYIGLNDKNTHQQKFDQEKYTNIVKEVCRNYRVPFSLSEMDGGYFHNDGSYVEEKTLCLTFFDLSKEMVMEIAKDLCTFFNQESVLVSSDQVETVFVEAEKFNI